MIDQLGDYCLFIYFHNLQTTQLLDLGITTVDTAQSPATPPEGIMGELEEMDEKVMSC